MEILMLSCHVVVVKYSLMLFMTLLLGRRIWFDISLLDLSNITVPRA